MMDLSSPEAFPALTGGSFHFRHDLSVDTVAPAGVPSLAAELPRGWIKTSPATAAFTDPRASASPSETDDVQAMAAEISMGDSCIRLYHLDHVAAFRETSSELDDIVSRLRPDTERIDLALFLAPGGAVTPAHPDRHHNLLLQLAGTKRVWVEDLTATGSVERHRRVVDYFRLPGRAIAALPPAREYVLGPGDGVYIPPTAYHWTQVEPTTSSVALSAGFRTPETRRAERCSYFDSRLHRLGWRSRPAGRAKLTLISGLDIALRRPSSLG